MPRPALLSLAALIVALAGVAAGGEIAATRKASGFDQMSPEIQAMQRDDTGNPGMLWVRDGADLWATPPASGKPACGGCHGEGGVAMRGVAARYPAWDDRSRAPIDLQGRINRCRTDRQDMPPLDYESPDLLALSAFVATQSRGQMIASPDDDRLEPARRAGRALFETRTGQLGLSCANCHDDNWGKRLGAAVIPQAHPTGYPIYRLEWQGLGSLQRRLRNCMAGMRAQPFAYGASEFIALELYLARRAAPLRIETPAVRP